MIRPAQRERDPDALLEACRAGDEAAWEHLFTLHAARVVRWAVLLGLTPSDAEEVAQETLATAARRIHTCRSGAVLVSWLYQIARRVTANRRRSAWWRYVMRRPSVRDPAFESHVERDGPTEITVRRVLARLPQAQAEVLMLIDVEGFTRREVSETLKIPEGTVASRHRAARETFARHWREADEP